MKLIISLLTVAILLLSINLFSDIDCTLTIDNVSVSASDYSFDIYITRNPCWTEYTGLGSAFGVFHSTLVFNVSNNAFSDPFTSDYGDPIDSAIECMPSTSILSIELLENGIPVPTTLSKLLNVCMTIINPDTTAGLSWDAINCVLFKSDNVSQVSTELIGYDNSSLPVSNANISESKYGLCQNNPNPFGRANSSTEIDFVIDRVGLAEIKIYNVRGQLVRNLYKGIVNKDEQMNLIWNGKDDEGNILPSGIYFYQLRVDKKPYRSKKLLLIR